MSGAAIIDRFGGSRPMARLLGLPASTVQHWKDIDLIPAQRHREVFDAGQALDPPLSWDEFFPAPDRLKGNGKARAAE